VPVTSPAILDDVKGGIARISMTYVVDVATMPFREDSNRRVQRLIHATTVGAKDGFAMGIVEYTSDEFGEPDLHQDHESLYVLEGHGVARLGSEEYHLSPGLCLYIPAGTPHSIVKRGSSPVRLIFARSGRRTTQE
jgi:mannose-6-phosphate isomerase-like protein (cupin superfamily)